MSNIQRPKYLLLPRRTRFATRQIFYGKSRISRTRHSQFTQKRQPPISYTFLQWHFVLAGVHPRFRHGFSQRPVAGILAHRGRNSLSSLPSYLAAPHTARCLARLAVFRESHHLAAEALGCRRHAPLRHKLLAHCPLPMGRGGENRGKKAFRPPRRQLLAASAGAIRASHFFPAKFIFR